MVTKSPAEERPRELRTMPVVIPITVVVLIFAAIELGFVPPSMPGSSSACVAFHCVRKKKPSAGQCLGSRGNDSARYVAIMSGRLYFSRQIHPTFISACATCCSIGGVND